MRSPRCPTRSGHSSPSTGAVGRSCGVPPRRRDRDGGADWRAQAYAAGGLPAPRRDRVGARPGGYRRRLGQAARTTAGDNVRALDRRSPCGRKAELAVDRAIGLTVRMRLAAEPGLSRVPEFCTSIDEAVLRARRSGPAGNCARGWPTFFPRRRRRLSFAASSFSLLSAPWLGTHAVSARRRAACSARPRRSRAFGQIAQQRLLDRAARARLLADGAAAAHPPRCQRPPACAGRPGAALRRRLADLRLEGHPCPRAHHRAARAASTCAASRRPRPANPALHDRHPDARSASSSRAAPIAWRRTRPASCGGSAGGGRHGRPWRSSTARRSRTAPTSTTSCRSPPTCARAREAVAWTYGLTEQRYRPVVRT